MLADRKTGLGNCRGAEKLASETLRERRSVRVDRDDADADIQFVGGAAENHSAEGTDVAVVAAPRGRDVARVGQHCVDSV
jgi:hypothetical protein